MTKKQYKSSGPEIVSFDVFDTIVTRNVIRPSDLYEKIEKLLEGDAGFILPAGEAISFSIRRVAAENRTRARLKGTEEVTLGEIYETLALEFSQLEPLASRLASFEIDGELNAVVPISLTLKLVGQMRESGKQVVFVSDTYLPAEVIEKILLKCGAFLPGDKLFVSSAVGKKKSSGSLFRYVLRSLCVQPGQLIHIGDYLLSDYLIPRLKFGIPSFPVRIARANVYERLWGDTCRCLYCSSVAGASRAARLMLNPHEISHENAASYYLGCNVLGPIITGFVAWTLQKASREGIKKLYFLSRDGEVLLQVARDLAVRMGVEIELKYLFVSRTAVFPALLGVGVSDRNLEWLKEDNTVLTVRVLANRLKIDPVRMYAELLRAGFKARGLDAPLDRQSVDVICSLLINDLVLNKDLAAKGQEVLLNLTGYLEHERFFDDVPAAVVDLGWRGSIQDALCTCFKERLGTRGLSGYYFGIDTQGDMYSKKSGFFFDSGGPPIMQKCRHLFRILLELLCSGTHGMVKDYRQNPDRIFVPVFDEIENSINLERIHFVRQGVSTFLKNLDVRDFQKNDYRHVVPTALKILKKLFFFPSCEEAFTLGGVYFSPDQAGHGVATVGPPFTQVSAIHYLSKRTYAGRSKISSWFFASWKRAEIWVWLLLLPLVIVLRLYYCFADIYKISKMIFIDYANRKINADFDKIGKNEFS